MRSSDRWNTLIAAEAKQQAAEFRRQAHHYRRTGYTRGFKTYMHDALRAWDKVKYYSRRAVQ